MKIITYLFSILFVTSCSPYPKGLHDDCRSYLTGFRSQWKRLPNGFYACEDMSSKRKNTPFPSIYVLLQEWDKHPDCTFNLSQKEVERIFGEPSIVEKASNDREKFTAIAFYYFIKDTTCNPQMEYPDNPGAYQYNRLVFVFYYGYDGSKPTPPKQVRLDLPCE